jgi:hypothetical protein
VALAGFVLHASRCGSTLVVRALETWPGVVVVNEPPALDDALRSARMGGDPAGLHSVLTALGGTGERVIVKTDAWHVLELQRLLAAAGDVPWLFVHRDPAEILVSHAAQPGSHTVPGVLDEVWFGPPRTVHALPHAAAVLAAIFTAAAAHATGAHLLGHAELPDALTTRVAGHFGLDPAEVDAAALDAVLAHHAKRPYLSYVDDRAQKQAAVTPQVADLVATVVMPAYRELLLRAGKEAA